MKKLLFAGAAFAALISGPAMGADQAPRVHRRPVVVPTWIGFYVGGNVGYSWGDARADIAGSAQSSTFSVFPANVGFANSDTARLNGVIVGGQIGYNYQLGPKWVLGFEADIQASGERGSDTLVDPFSTQVCNVPGIRLPAGVIFCAATGPLSGTAVTAYEAKIGSVGTVRGRLGVLVTDQVLLYGTGGLAYGQVKLSGVTYVNGSFPQQSTNLPLPFDAASASVFSEDKNKVGFAIGGGVEGKCSYWLPTGWTWKLEYLYVDLGLLDASASFPGANPLGRVTTPFIGAITTHTHFTDNIVRVGLNYQFSYAAAPALYK